MLSFFTYIHKMKVCNKCHIEKSYVEFYKKKSSPDGLQNTCKICHKQNLKQNYLSNSKRHKQQTQLHRLSHILPYWIVYQLPNADNYVGQTNNPYYRMSNHKCLGRDVTGWIELHRYNTQDEALAKEAEYHSQGYPGAGRWKHNEIKN